MFINCESLYGKFNIAVLGLPSAKQGSDAFKDRIVEPMCTALIKDKQNVNTGIDLSSRFEYKLVGICFRDSFSLMHFYSSVEHNSNILNIFIQYKYVSNKYS